MRRGTTPVHKFIVPFLIEDAQDIQIVYKQYNKILIEKHLDEIEVIPSNDGESTMLVIKLTQEDTFKFDARQKALIQIRLLIDDDALSSTVIPLDVDYSLDENILE